MKSEGSIGDVKYSVLPPDQFREENGNGWFLMDDTVPLAGSDLNLKFGVTVIPDARGLFIRSLNGRRDDAISDRFAIENGGRSRLMGEYQDDSFREHNHGLNLITGHGVWTHGDNTPGQGWACQWHPKQTHFQGAGETRPKNIALYTYIKISD